MPAGEHVKQIQEWIRKCKNHGHVVEMSADCDSEFVEVWRAYQDILQSTNTCDFDDLLALVSPEWPSS